MSQRTTTARIIIATVICLTPSSVFAFDFGVYDNQKAYSPYSYTNTPQDDQVHALMNRIDSSYMDGSYRSPVPGSINWQTYGGYESYTPDGDIWEMIGEMEDEHEGHDHDEHEYDEPEATEGHNHEEHEDHDDHEEHAHEAAEAAPTKKKTVATTTTASTNTHAHTTTSATTSGHNHAHADSHESSEISEENSDDTLKKIELALQVSLMENQDGFKAVRSDISKATSNTNIALIIIAAIQVFASLTAIILKKHE